MRGLGIAAEINESSYVVNESIPPDRLDPPADAILRLENHGRTTGSLYPSRRGETSYAAAYHGGPRVFPHDSSLTRK
ncbi:hypothetical protein Mkiyose1665_01490 [Mycobacterium kiyosense]|uniref:Uncharacterized protein n=1 Tax=Mycobacterium kiyosense TaxID=2871094 RepID=A0A9P3Q3P0_9MYCO|nr:hypothetical protein IWGMT90018_46070 [Mycobacterium kiyosense]BDE15694.1 hypothetical protein MKCMC460_45540 [Mycobacterium sp. 20KCMC460]GLB80886.1 hypothetical protein SRL2020028_01420 [Mycobacterium kiyosense]GLB87354.1 hypothetical protein SRL2020130_01710 [Mycobacterium kiyosense]GLB93366.1 hypothetical protein SRL2020226_01420 [Mycobacterium kiyosense]